MRMSLTISMMIWRQFHTSYLRMRIHVTETSVYRERAVKFRTYQTWQLGLSLRPQNKPVHITSGLNEATVDEMYYEPPLMQVIPSACNACEDNVYEVSNLCRGCLAHPVWRYVRGMQSRMWMVRHILISTKCV